MNRVLTIVVLVFALFGATSTGAKAFERKYICQTTQSTGFYFENGSWQQARFKIEGEIYIATYTKNDGIVTWHFQQLGESFPLCKQVESGLMEHWEDYANCNGLHSFRFNVKAGRFIATYTAGYTDGQDNNDDTPNISIGLCSPLNP